jgi:hypothetical protein
LYVAVLVEIPEEAILIILHRGDGGYYEAARPADFWSIG